MHKYVRYFRHGVLTAVVGLYLVAAFVAVITALPDLVSTFGRFMMFFVGIPMMMFPIVRGINNGPRFALFFISGVVIALVGLGLGSTQP
jgi:hypothetical protein